jgi:hypothetical protein
MSMEMDHPDQPASAVDPTGLLPNIIRYCLYKDDASRLALGAQFMNALDVIKKVDHSSLSP